ncbi:fasciclin domain-containing protein [Marinibacterium profundimaris]|uniref:FAS1 domain-containing protein n=1 Tax=Marinibacterium profundimaris TaxID=1679460 RepID=A0A225NJA4_9RHOB|nr:fasciclin domain-containing protein [Marinibacterium profundimaris]OWU73670.1 hypothetical protein ATO3_13675 [Marinibacterium profundimaris]
MSLGSTLNAAFDPMPADPTLKIAQIANSPDFDILSLALFATGLTTTFNRPGDFTVFAPTDDAFRTLAEQTLGLDVSDLSDRQVAFTLVDTLGAEFVTDVLTYHVTAGATSLADLQAQGDVTTFFGTDVTVSRDQIIDADPDVENPEFLNGLTDIAATNGVIHAIDRVLLPLDVAEAETSPTIADVATTDSRFEILTAALVATGLDAAVADRDADLTVFAPTDVAFRKLARDLGLDDTGLTPAQVAEALIDAVGIETVTDVLLYHVSPESLSAAELTEEGIVETALDNGRLLFDEGKVLDASPQTDASVYPALVDIGTANGTIHILDSVLLPFDLDPQDTVGRGTGMADRAFTGGGNDRYWAAGGDDIIIDGAGDDQLFGAQGSDTLSDGAGNDIYVGGEDADIFDFTAMQGRNGVRDFTSEDVLVFSRDDFATEQDVLDSAILLDKGLRIDGEDGSVLLGGVMSLTADDFILY